MILFLILSPASPLSVCVGEYLLVYKSACSYLCQSTSVVEIKDRLRFCFLGTTFFFFGDKLSH